MTGHSNSGSSPERDDADLLDVTVSSLDGNVELISVAGEVDMLTVSRLRPVVLRTLSRVEPEAVVVIDLTEVTFLASSGLAVLAQAFEYARDEGIDLRIVSPTRATSLPISAAGLDGLLNPYRDRDSATKVPFVAK